MKTKPWAILLVLASSLLISVAQIMYKIAADRLVFTNVLTYLTNYPFIIGFFVYAAAGIFLIYSFRGGEVSVLYPLFASTYILVILISKFIFHETITSNKWIGVVLIMLGITLISIGSKKKHSTLEYEVAV